MIKSFSFIVSTHFFHFNELLKQPGYFLFKLKLWNYMLTYSTNPNSNLKARSNQER